MSLNLNDFLGDHPALLWLVLAALLVAAWSVLPRRRLLHVAAALLPAAVSALVWPGLGWVQVLVAVLAVAAVLLVGRRAAAGSATPASAG